MACNFYFDLEQLQNGMCHELFSTVEDKIMDKAPFALIISSWNLISEATFLRKRRNRVPIRGAWPITALYMPEIQRDISASVYLVINSDEPSTMDVISATSSPKRGSATYLSRSRKIGSKRTSSRPAKAIFNPSRWINSWMSENVIVGGTFYAQCKWVKPSRRTLERPFSKLNQEQRNIWSS